MAANEQIADVVVLGAGPAGYVCAIRLAQLGKKVTVVERAKVGGVCLNVGCIPSKALIHAGGLLEKIKHGSEIGIETDGAKVNMPKLMAWKDSVVQKLTGGVETLLKANGCAVINGEARFLSPKKLEVKTSAGVVTVSFNQCVVATGSRPFKLPGVEVDQKKIVDSTGALNMTEVSKTLLCIGGGYIGLELGTFYAKVGSKVTVVEAAGSLLSGVDPDLTKLVSRKLDKLGVNVMLKTTVKGCKANKKGVEVTLSEDGKEKTQDFDSVMVTVGRVPNSDGLGLERAGVKLDSKGFVTIDARRRTNVPHIYAIGNVAGQPLLAHKGSKEGIVAAEVVAGMKTVYDVRAMPAVIFTDPEIATVGLGEAEAKTKGIDVNVGVFPFAANGRALSVGEPDGLVKMIADKTSGTLLGVHIAGVEASNLISEAALAIEMGANVEDLALTVHPHPTLPETLMEAAEATLGHSIHMFKRKPSTPQPEASA